MTVSQQDERSAVNDSVSSRPKLAVFKFASCDGCQLSLLDCEDELLAVAGAVEIAYFLEATRRTLEGPYDVTLVEGSITTEEDRKRIREVRKQSKRLITIGACATSGGIQALRNFADVGDFIRAVYAEPRYIRTLATSTAISDHVPVDYELRGCPIDKHQLLEVLLAALQGRTPAVRSHSVCIECKARGTTCLMVSKGSACLGPVTHAGCNALCPSYDRPCFGCFGPAESCNATSLVEHLRACGASDLELTRLYATFNVAAPAFVPAHRLVARTSSASHPPSVPEGEQS